MNELQHLTAHQTALVNRRMSSALFTTVSSVLKAVPETLFSIEFYWSHFLVRPKCIHFCLPPSKCNTIMSYLATEITLLSLLLLPLYNTFFIASTSFKDMPKNILMLLFESFFSWRQKSILILLTREHHYSHFIYSSLSLFF